MTTYADQVTGQESSPYDVPTRCPACSSARIAPLFWDAADVWDCSRCGAVFCGRD